MAPAISGTARDEQTLSSSTGTWSGLGNSYSRQWLRCDAAGNACAGIPAATQNGYVLTPADVGKTIRVRVLASYALGSNDATSAQTAVVTPAPPASSGVPALSGTARDTQTLTASTGAWRGTPPLSFRWQWRRCDSAGTNCADIAGQATAAYRLTASDVGKTVRVSVTASNVAGSAPATSAASAAIVPDPPANTGAPTISGVVSEGRDLSVERGTWTTPAIGYAYQWQRCVPGGSCVPIGGATTATYTLVAADLGQRVVAAVTATNAAASRTANSATTDVVAAGKPFPRAAPSMSGTEREGQQLTAAPGTWTGTSPIAYTYQCLRCSPAGAACAPITGADQRTYTLQSPDAGKKVHPRVTAANGAGSTQADGPVSGVIAGNAPSNTAAPSITGTAEAGKPVTAQPGSWAGTAPIAYAFEWQHCDGAGNACQPISGATTATYTLTGQDADLTVRVRVTATNATGSTQATSAVRAVQAQGCTTTFLPASGSWETAASWSGGAVPAASDHVCIPVGRSAHVAADAGTIASLRGDGELRLYAGLALSSTERPSRIGKLLLENASTLSGAGDLTIGTSLTWGNATMSGTGRTIIPQGATGYIERGELSRTLVNEGTITATSTSSGANFFRGTSSAVLENRGTFTLDIVNTPYGDVRGLLKSDPAATPRVHNTGLFRKTSAGSNHIEWRLDNDGVVQPNGTGTDGWMVFTGGGVQGDESTGTWGQGSYWFQSDHKLAPETRMTGKVLLVGGTLHARSVDIGEEAEIRVRQGTLASTDTSSPSRVANLVLENVGDIGGAGDLIVTKSLNWTGGTMTGAGRTILPPGATGTITRGELGRTLVNRGQLTFERPSFDPAWFWGLPGAVLDNEGVLNLNSQTTTPQMRATAGAPTAVLRNRGIVRKSAGTGDTTVDWAYADQGITQELTTGELQFIGPITGSGVGSADSAGPMPGELQGGFNAAIPGLSTCAEADPVSCMTGDFYENLSDIEIAGRGRSLAAARSYSAQAAEREAGTAASGGPAGLGPGWTHPYATRLELPTGYVRLVGANGAAALWKANADGTFGAAERVKARLTRGDANGYVVTYKDQTRDVFDSAGRLLRQVDRNGYATTVAYDGNGRIDYVADEAGRRLTYAHDGTGRISSITDPAERVVSYGYDAKGDLTTVVDVAGETWSYGYDGRHRVVSMRDPLDRETTNVYDAESRVARQTDAAGGVTRFAYTPSGTTVTNPRGNMTRYELTGGLVSRVVRGVGSAEESTVSMVRNASGNVTRRTDPDGQLTRVEYDGAGNATKLTDPLDRVTTMTYSPANDVLTVSEPGSATTTMTYDGGGNVGSVSRPLTGTGSTQSTAYAYDPARPGDLVSLTDPSGKVWRFGYDGYGNRTSSTNPEGDTSTIAYNQLGWPVSSVSARGNAAGADPDAYRSSTEYDDRGRPVLQTDPLDATVRTGYDAVGNPILVTEPGEKTTGTTYDELDRPTIVTRADGSVLRFGYDANGNRTSVKDGAGRETTFSYDVLDRKESERDPAGRLTTYGYDRSGRQTTLRDAAGRVTSLSYDVASQLQQIDYADGATADVDVDYDVAGRRVRMVDGTGTSSYEYDAFGRVSSATDGAGRRLRYAYDLADRLTKITYPADLVADTAPAGRTIADPSVTRAYDDAGRVTAITDWLGARTEYDHDADGNVTEQRYPNQTKAVMAYDRSGRLARRTDSGPGSVTVLDLPYMRRLNGQLQAQNRPGDQPAETQSLAYDDLDQLAEATVGSGAAAQTYGYAHDVADRLTRIASPDAATALEYDAANQLVRTRDTATGQTRSKFNYDAVGNRTMQDPAGPVAATTLAYDQASRLTRIEAPASPGGDPAVERDYAYDGDGLRADLLWDSTGGLPLVLGDSAGLYVTGPDGLALTQLTFDGEQRYYHHDQLGSTRAITNTNGTVTARYTFDPYGNPAAGSSTDSRFGYAGQYTDRQSGLIYMRARWYDPATAQFITTDPIGMASGETNLYRYAGGDPANIIDPTGLFGLTDLTSAIASLDNPVSQAVAGALNGALSGAPARIFGFDAACVGGVFDFGNSYLSLAVPLPGATLARAGRLAAKDSRVFNSFARSADELPRLDRTGKVHGNLPRGIPGSWTRNDLEEFASDLRGSIQTRHAEQTRLGEHGPHRARINEEQQLLRRIEKDLSGS